MGAVIIAGRYVPRPPEDNLWDARPKGIAPLRMPVGGGFPFVNKRASFNYDDATVWYRNSSSFAALRMPVGGGFPFKPAFWTANYDDASTWQNESVPTPPVSKLVGGNFPFVPKRWAQDYDDASHWQRKPFPVPPVRDLVGGNFPFVNRRFSFGLDDYAAWDKNRSTFPTLGLPATAGVIVAGRYVPRPPTDELWTGKPTPVSPLYTITAAPLNPFLPKAWRFDYDQPREWVGQSGFAFVALTTTLQLFSPSIMRPFQSGEETREWSGNRQVVNNLLLNTVVLAAPFVPRFWAYNNNDPGTWRGGPVNVGIVQQLVIASPLLPSRWKMDYDQAAFWSGAPSNVPITITQPGPPVVSVGAELHNHPFIATMGQMMTI